eukprot:3228393-Rhodomonas_salina.2
MVFHALCRAGFCWAFPLAVLSAAARTASGECGRGKLLSIALAPGTRLTSIACSPGSLQIEPVWDVLVDAGCVVCLERDWLGVVRCEAKDSVSTSSCSHRFCSPCLRNTVSDPFTAADALRAVGAGEI